MPILQIYELSRPCMPRQRHRPSFHETIEYIGPRPKKPKRAPSFLGGWFLLLIAGAIAFYFGRPLLPSLRAHQERATVARADQLIARLAPSASFGERLAAAALQRTKADVDYDPSFYGIPYPSGDVPSNRGYGPDVVIRSYRALGIDLQQLVFEDMSSHFNAYPQLPEYGMRKGPDSNIDHRRVPNLQRFFSRFGVELPADRDVGHYSLGDVVIWQVGSDRHIGIVVPGPGERVSERWVVHNLNRGPVWEDCLFDFEVVGHYRYNGATKAPRKLAASESFSSRN
jgi:uncharacterized protein YijF (DUF1287 family)